MKQEHLNITRFALRVVWQAPVLQATSPDLRHLTPYNNLGQVFTFPVVHNIPTVLSSSLCIFQPVSSFYAFHSFRLFPVPSKSLLPPAIQMPLTPLTDVINFHQRPPPSLLSLSSFCLVSGHYRGCFQSHIISFFIPLYKVPFLRTESQKGTQAALKRQWSGCWKQSIFQNTALQSRTFILAETRAPFNLTPVKLS